MAHIKKILLLGKSGQVGSELATRLALIGNLTSMDRSDCDIQDSDCLRSMLERVDPDVIVNAAAYTAVDLAESNILISRCINENAVKIMAEFCKIRGKLLVHYSTDYVFDGNSSEAYGEFDQTNPVSEYGLSKLLGELAISRSGCSHVILRTSWVFGVIGKNFLKTMLLAMSNGRALSVVNDQWGAPTSAALIADVTLLVLRECLSQETPVLNGIYHLSASGVTTWYEYACFIASVAQRIGLHPDVAPSAISPISTHDFHARARRPVSSRLDTTRLERELGILLPQWEVGVESVIRQLSAGNRTTGMRPQPTAFNRNSNSQVLS